MGRLLFVGLPTRDVAPTLTKLSLVTLHGPSCLIMAFLVGTHYGLIVT